MIANEPEILLEDKEELKKIGVDLKSGQVTIPIRRGASKNGIRNPDESISITISNIPDGYYLAQRVGEKYEQIGATDTFGTITLFSKSKESPDRSQEELSKYQLLNDGNLYLVKRYDQAFIEDGSKLKIEVNSLISDEGSSDSRSDKSTEYINITGVETPKYNRINNFIDPLIIDIDRDNRFELTSLDNSHVKFNMIPGKGSMNTGWISENENKSKKNAAFIVYNDKFNDTDEIVIGSTAEMFSEYFGTTRGNATFRSGTEALASLDINLDGILDAKDETWQNIQLWFDDGDAISSASEIDSIQKYIDYIDLKSTEGVLNKTPEWSSENVILSKTNAYKASKTMQNYKLYDVGLEVRPSEGERISLNVNRTISMKEGGASSSLELQSPDGEKWIEDGKSDLTLVRVSGIPNEIIPTYGVKDIRGDWLFTWTELAAADGKFDLIPDIDWSGDANISVMVSQVQESGDIISSAIKTIRLNVEAVADTPILRLREQRTKEDIPIALRSFIQQASIKDKDDPNDYSLSA